MYFLLIHLVLVIFPRVNADKVEIQEKLLGYVEFVIHGEFFEVRINTVEQIQILQDFLDHLSKHIEDNSSTIDVVQIIIKRLKFFTEESSLYEPTKCVLKNTPSSLKISPYSNESIDYINFIGNIVKYTRVVIALLKTCSFHYEELENSEIFSQTNEFIRFLHLKQIELILEIHNYGKITPHRTYQLEGLEYFDLPHTNFSEI